MSMETGELLRQLETNGLAVFGTGFVAEMFHEALKIHGLESRIRFYAVTKASPGQSFRGRPVRSLADTDPKEDLLFCVAVHASAAREVMEVLKEHAGRCVWIYPNLFELLYGAPVKDRCRLTLQELLAGQDPGEHWLSVRYAAIRDYLGCRERYPETKKLYLRAMSVHCEPPTAARRLTELEKLAGSMMEKGFEADSPVIVDESGRIIDGLHRVCCAAYLHMKSVPATVYPASPVFDRVLGVKNRLPESVLLDAGFSEPEIHFLREAWCEMTEQAYR